MRKSTNYGLNLLDEDDFYSEELLNANAEKIDEVLKSLDNPDYDVEEQSDVEELEPGESLTISIRKLAKAVKDYISHKADTENPHKVTKSQVGLSDVPNVTTNNQTPTYNVASETAELKSGEVLSTAFGKLAKAVADYISHKADVLAHITAEERNAWNAKLGAEKIAANLTTTTEGMVLAAAMGKTLKEQVDKNATDISTLNSNNMFFSSLKKQISAVGWYRIAKFSGDTNAIAGAGCNSVGITIKRNYNNETNEYHEIKLLSVYNSQEFKDIFNKSNVTRFTKIRYAKDTVNKIAYIEVYYNSTFANDFRVTLMDRSSSADGMWENCFEVTSETVDGVEITTELEL